MFKVFRNKDIVQNDHHGEKMRVAMLEDQIKELAAAAAAAVDRAELLEAQLKDRSEAISVPLSPAEAKHIVASTSMRSIQTNATSNTLFSSRPRSRSSSFSNDSVFSSEPADLKVVADLEASLTELKTKLAHESQLRVSAEARERALTAQIEDLSVSLFEDANTRVAQEKKKAHELQLKLDQLTKDPRESRLRNIENAICAIHQARAVLNSGRLHTYVS